MPEDKEDKIIDLPSDGPDTEVILPEETVKEGAQNVDVPEKKPEGEVEVVEEKKEEATMMIRCIVSQFSTFQCTAFVYPFFNVSFLCSFFFLNVGFMHVRRINFYISIETTHLFFS